MIQLFDTEPLNFYEAYALSVPDHDDHVDWDAWLTQEALGNGTDLSAAQYDLIDWRDCDESQMLLPHTFQFPSNRPEISLPSDGSLHLAQPIDAKRDYTTTNLQTPSPVVYDAVKCKNTENPHLVSREYIKLKPPKPSDALGCEDRIQKTFLTLPDFDLKVQYIEPGISQNHQSVNKSIHADQYIDCIRTICQTATGETLSQKQARDIKNCCDSLVTNLRSDGTIAALKSLLVNCHLHALPRVESNNLNSSLTACVAYLRFLDLIAGSTSKTDDMNRRLFQIWIYLHFENHVSDLKEREENGIPLNRRGREISTVARDSILQLYHGSQFMPRKADRDFLSDQCRWGERWWRVATCMGLGVVFFASEDLVDQIGRRTAFQNKMVDTLAIYFLNRYLGLIDIYRSFDPMAVGLMLGGNKPCSRAQLSIFLEVLAEDEAFLSGKQEKWLIPDLRSLSRLAAAHLIFTQRSLAIDSPTNC